MAEDVLERGERSRGGTVEHPRWVVWDQVPIDFDPFVKIGRGGSGEGARNSIAMKASTTPVAPREKRRIRGRSSTPVVGLEVTSRSLRKDCIPISLGAPADLRPQAGVLSRPRVLG